MRVPIPDDWGGETWACYQVQFPDSPQWTAIFLGLLTYATRGRFWDERSGSILAAQEIGQAIYEANFPFVDCDGAAVDSSDDDFRDFAARVCVAIEGGIDTMSLCGYNPKAFRVNDGMLEVRDFCGEWVEIGSVGTDADQPPVVIPPDIDTNETGIYPCGKAEKLASELVKFIDEAWDESDNTLPIAFIWHMQNYMSYDLKNFWTDQVQSACLIAKGAVVTSYGLVNLQKSEVIPAGVEEELTCRLLSAMSDTAEDDKTSIYSTLRTALDSIFPPFSIPDGVFINSIWQNARQALGEQLCHDIAQAGAYTDAECNCEGGTINPPTPYSGLVWFENTRNIELQTSALLETVSQTLVNQMQFTVAGSPNDNYKEVHWTENLKASGTISELEVRLYNRQIAQAGDYFPTHTWSEVEPSPTNLYLHPPIEGVTVPDSTTFTDGTNEVLMVYKWDTPINLDAAKIALRMKVNPKVQSGGNQNRLYLNLDIQYAGDQR